MSKSGNTITTDMNCRIIMKNIAKTRAKRNDEVVLNKYNINIQKKGKTRTSQIMPIDAYLSKCEVSFHLSVLLKVPLYQTITLSYKQPKERTKAVGKLQESYNQLPIICLKWKRKRIIGW
ncbi:hypothetical protein CUMW_133070 [Citrus unshiu]|nr:hypothetical protein CUMW_133070 [Citrus unshiu]